MCYSAHAQFTQVFGASVVTSRQCTIMAVKTLDSIDGIESLLRKKVQDERKSYKTTAAELRNKYPHLTRGLSARSIRRFCKGRDIHPSSRLTASQLDRVVSSSVSKVHTVRRICRLF